MYKLIIADDEFETRNGLLCYFPWQQIGFEIVGAAEDGKSALDMAAEKEADVLLCDICMPMMDGVEVARYVYEHHLKLPIVFLSGYKEFEYAQKAVEYGVRRYITKPTQYLELAEVFSQIREELDACKLKKGEKEDPAGQSGDGIAINKVKAYIRNNYATVTLSDAAMIVGMNFQYLSRLFKQRTGQNFSDFVLDVRMENAMRLLADPRYRISDISQLVGYVSPQNFAHVFKKYCGKTPKEYRESLP